MYILHYNEVKHSKLWKITLVSGVKAGAPNQQHLLNYVKLLTPQIQNNQIFHFF